MTFDLYLGRRLSRAARTADGKTPKETLLDSIELAKDENLDNTQLTTV